MFAYYYTVLISLYILTLHHILFCLPVLFCLFLVHVFPSSVPSDYSKTVLSKIPMPSVLQNFENSFSFLFFLFFLLLFKDSCLHFPATIFLHPTHCYHPPSTLPPLALSMGPLYMFLDDPSPFFPHYPLPAPLWLLSVCSLYQCL